MKIDVRCKKFKMYLGKSKLASRHEDGKNVSCKILQIKTNPDNATDYILKCKASANWIVMQS